MIAAGNIDGVVHIFDAKSYEKLETFQSKTSIKICRPWQSSESSSVLLEQPYSYLCRRGFAHKHHRCGGHEEKADLDWPLRLDNLSLNKPCQESFHHWGNRQAT
jgi:hypothetical protein